MIFSGAAGRDRVWDRAVLEPARKKPSGEVRNAGRSNTTVEYGGIAAHAMLQRGLRGK